MFSIRYFLTIFLACVAVSRAEQASSGKKPALSARMLGDFSGLGMPLGGGFMGMGGFSYYNAFDMFSYPWLSAMTNPLGGCFGFGMLPNGLYNNFMFAKAADDSPAVSRRAVTLDAEQLFPRSADKTVSCVNEKGAANLFVTSHCIKAANKLAENKLSQASCGRCTLSLVSAKGKVEPKHVSAAVLEQAAQGILKACSSPKNAQHPRRSSAKHAQNHEHQVAMVLSKGVDTAC